MISLHLVDFYDIQKYFVDFQKKSKAFDMPPESAQNIGIFQDAEMIGYYIIQGYNNTDVEVVQGYLKPQYRHKDLPKHCMKLLEDKCKEAGYKKMMLATGSRFKAYLRFAEGLGYKPKHLEFSKEL